MTVERNVARAVVAMLAMLVVFAGGSQGAAMAAAPSITINAPLAGSSTNNQTPPISGTTNDVTDQMTVNIYAGASAGGTPVQTLFVSALEISPLEGTWATAPKSALEPGQYTAVAEQTNAEPQTGKSVAVTFTVDTTPPVVSIDSVVSPSNDSTPTLTGGAGTAVGDDPTVVVMIYEGGSTSGSLVRTVGGTVSGSTWSAGPVAALPDGTYTAQASQSDEAGNTGKSAAVTFTVDTTAPVVSIDSVVSPSNDSTPTLTGGAGTAVGDDPTVVVMIYEGGSTSGSLLRTVGGTVSGSTWSAGPVASLPDGTYTAQASQSDEAGNVGRSAAVTFTVDTTAPVVSIDSVVSPSNDATPTLTGGAGMAVGDDPTVFVMIYEGGSTSGSLVRTVGGMASGSTWSAGPVASLPDGTYTAQASQSDEAGNVGRSAAVTFTVDTVAPVVSIDSVVSPSNDATPTLTGGAGMAVGDDPTVVVMIYEGGSTSGSLVRTVGGTVSGSTWSAGPVAALPDGTYTAQVSQSDEAGNTGKSAAVTFTVDTTPPAVAVTTPAAGGVLDFSRPTVSGLAGQASGDDPSVTVKLYAGPVASGSPVQKLKVTPSAGAWTTGSTVSALANGIYTALAEQSDEAGNTGTSTVTFTITTSTPIVTLEASGLVARGPLRLTGPTPSFTGSASTAPEDGKSVIVDVYNGASVSGSLVRTVEGALGGGSTWGAGPVVALADGTYTARAEQKDSDFHGQTGMSTPVTFTVDADPPVVTLTSPASGSSTSAESESVGGTSGAAEGDLPTITVKLFAGSTIASQAPLETVMVQAVKERWTAAFGGLSSGTYTARAQQSDDVGNTGVSKPVTFTVTAPKVPVPAVSPPTPPQAPPSPPVASFQWFPSAPHVGEPVSLVSTSTDATGQITGFAWSLAGNGVFTGGADTLTTSFSTPGAHVVLLRVTDASGQSSLATETIPVTSPVPTLMQPFPVVRIAGSENASGVRVGLLSVQAPVGALVTVTCRGPGCRTRSQGVVAGVGKGRSTTGMAVIVFGRFERSLRAGAVLEIRVSKPGQIGKYTRFRVRRGKLPERVDTCLSPAGIKPIVCPSS